MNILIDGRHSRAGGGRSFLRAVLAHWCELPEATGDRLYVLTGDRVLMKTVQAPQIVWCRSREWHPMLRQTIGHLTVWQLLHSRRFDAVYLPGNFGLPYTPCAVPVVVTLQNPHLPQATENDAPLSLRIRLNVERAMFRFTAKKASAVTTISYSLHSKAVEMLGDRTRLVLIRSGGAPPTIGSYYRDSDSRGTAPAWGSVAISDAVASAMKLPYVLAVGNFYLHKHHERVVELCAAAFGTDEGVPRLVVVGNGGQRSAVRRFDRTVKRLNYPVLRLEGLDAADLRILYKRCLAYVSASTREAYPLTPEEAEAEGARVVLSDIPAHREVMPSADFFPVDDLVRGGKILAKAAFHYDESGRATRDSAEDLLSRGWHAHAGQLRRLFSELGAERE